MGAYAIVANIARADSCLRLGARVVVQRIPGNPDNVEVRGVSRNGRVVTKYVKASRLRDMRVAWEHQPPFALAFATREDAAKVIAARFVESAWKSGVA